MKTVSIRSPDWALLREQKAYCFNEANNNIVAAHLYDGLLSLLDHIQDNAVAQGIATEEEVFG